MWINYDETLHNVIIDPGCNRKVLVHIWLVLGIGQTLFRILDNSCKGLSGQSTGMGQSHGTILMKLVPPGCDSKKKKKKKKSDFKKIYLIKKMK